MPGDHYQPLALAPEQKKERTFEALLAQQFQGLVAVYGSRAMPPWLQTDIGNIFKSEGCFSARAKLGIAIIPASRNSVALMFSLIILFVTFIFPFCGLSV